MRGPEPYPGPWELCKLGGTQLHVSVSCGSNNRGVPLECGSHLGGSCLWLWRKTWGIRLDGFGRRNCLVEPLPQAVTEPRPRVKTINRDEAEIHTIPFTNHEGNRAFMVFQKIFSPLSQLPPLFPLVVYFTDPHANLDPTSMRLTELYKAIRDPMENVQFGFRLDVYFLPWAQPVDCISHYLAARNSRIASNLLVHEFEQNIMNNDFAHPPTRLPRMVHAYPNKLRLSLPEYPLHVF
ncbi:hypothetical protein BDW74DRAFT_123893 [Aspergillus multicolor]|uniref:uncharacterized protein n=1 Tax=Aspergillus multicolor TaxID=41759 RepID=UPI003CCC8FDF